MKKQIITILIISLVSIQLANTNRIINEDSLKALSASSTKLSRRGDPYYTHVQEKFGKTITFLLPCTTERRIKNKWDIKVTGASKIYDKIVNFDESEIEEQDARNNIIQGYCKVIFKIQSSEFLVEAKHYLYEYPTNFPTEYAFKAYSSLSELR